MLDKFLSYIKAENLFTYEDKILLAVSGGMDSMVLLHLFQQMTNNVIVAHVNHNLRGVASDADQYFVEKYCVDHNILCYVTHIAPSVFEHVNMHDTARKIRYNWFNEILEKENLQYIATGHHADDVSETFLINLIRGSGLDGLSSLKAKNNNIIRPILFASKEDILNYIHKYNIPYREDESNSSQKYLRNKIRHNLIPALEHIDSRSKKGLIHSSRHIHSSAQLLNWLVEKERPHYCHEHEGLIIIKFSELAETPNPVELLYQLIKKYGFNEIQCTQMLAGNQKSGNKYISHIYTALRDRGNLILKANNSLDFSKDINFLCPAPPAMFSINGFHIKMEKVPNDMNFNFTSNNIQYVCTDKIELSSLVIRSRRNGDTFASIGMKGKKQKIQDYLTNIKLTASQKEKILLLTHSDEIIAILGHRVSENVKVTADSIEILKIEICTDPDMSP